MRTAASPIYRGSRPNGRPRGRPRGRRIYGRVGRWRRVAVARRGRLRGRPRLPAVGHADGRPIGRPSAGAAADRGDGRGIGRPAVGRGDRAVPDGPRPRAIRAVRFRGRPRGRPRGRQRGRPRDRTADAGRSHPTARDGPKRPHRGRRIEGRPSPATPRPSPRPSPRSDGRDAAAWRGRPIGRSGKYLPPRGRKIITAT